MARENMEEWGTSFSIVLDTIRVTVEAFATGKVEFKSVSDDTGKKHIRGAPSFLTGRSGGPPERPYTASTIGDFLGWLDTDGHASTRLRHGLNAQELIELDCMQASNFDGLGKEAGYELTTQTKKTYGRPRPTEGSRVAHGGCRASMAPRMPPEVRSCCGGLPARVAVPLLAQGRRAGWSASTVAVMCFRVPRAMGRPGTKPRCVGEPGPYQFRRSALRACPPPSLTDGVSCWPP